MSAAIFGTRNQRDLVDGSIIVTGAPRSGTTLVGKLVATLESVEYSFEPPLVYLINALVATRLIDREIAALILRVHLYEELLLEMVCGRRANLRPQDDSLILNSIPWTELTSRWMDVRNRDDAAKRVADEGVRLAFKMPNIMDGLDFFCETLSRSQVVLVVRDGRSVVRSIFKKRWLSDEGLKEELWPYRTLENGRQVPYWVRDDSWHTMTEVERCSYMWRRHAEWAWDFLRSGLLDEERLHVVRYEELLQTPADSVAALSRFLGCAETANTRQRRDEIRSPPSRRDDEMDGLFDLLNKSEREEFDRINALWEYR